MSRRRARAFVVKARRAQALAVRARHRARVLAAAEFGAQDGNCKCSVRIKEDKEAMKEMIDEFKKMTSVVKMAALGLALLLAVVLGMLPVLLRKL